jgi:hypothetical protein
MQATEQDRILDRLRKLLAMAERGNSPREQAIARRRAEALMRRHGIHPAEVFATATPSGGRAGWEAASAFRAEPEAKSEVAVEADGRRFAVLAQWAVRLSWLLILVVPVSGEVVAAPLPAFPDVLQMLADAWSGSGLLAAVLALLLGSVKLALVALWSAFWALSVVMHTTLWELTDWSRFAMGPGLLHLPIACALGALVAWLSAILFGYDARREHRVVFYAGVAVTVLTVALMLALLALGKVEDGGARVPGE